jgi:hypothetical protein
VQNERVEERPGGTLYMHDAFHLTHFKLNHFQSTSNHRYNSLINITRRCWRMLR